MYCCEWFQTYLWGQRIIAETDHNPMEAIQLNHLTTTPPPPKGCRQCFYVSNHTMLPLSTGWARKCGLLMHYQFYGLMSKIHCMTSMYRYAKCVPLMKKKKSLTFFLCSSCKNRPTPVALDFSLSSITP